MKRRLGRELEVEASIRDVLMTYRDPINVNGEPCAADEYDGCVGGVYRLLASGATESEVADHVATVPRPGPMCIYRRGRPLH